MAFIIDAYAKWIVGWRASSSMTTDFALDALEQAVYDRRPTQSDGLIHHSDRGSQYVSIRDSERLSEAGISPSVGNTGSAYDNALAETINGLYKTELIHRRAPWKTKAPAELATLEWVSWFKHQRLLESIGDIPPAKTEGRYYRQLAAQAAEPVYFNQMASAIPGSIQPRLVQVDSAKFAPRITGSQMASSRAYPGKLSVRRIASIGCRVR